MGSAANLDTVVSWLRDNHSVEISRFEPTGGGCINETGIATLSNGERLFIKRLSNPPDDFFAAEAHGLNCLRRATSLRIPEVIHVGQEFLLLEELGNGVPIPDFWHRLGEGLAELHQCQSDTFGLQRDNYCGSTRQINCPTSDGHRFFARHRLLELGDRALQEGLLTAFDYDRLKQVADGLRQWIPEQPAVLLHGDLWSGNVHCDRDGMPTLIDPACYYGWAEAELAMTILFGGFPGEFYSAYQSAAGIESAWRQRAPLYNLYHLLNHLLLFGNSYLAQVRQVLDRFTD